MKRRCIDDALREARSSLADAHVTDTPDLEARLLLQKATDLDCVHLIMERNRILSREEEAKFSADLKERLSSTPMAYLLGHREFYDLDFHVDNRVLIPRSDSETLIDAVLSTTKPSPKLRLLDLCAGSGCLGITLSRHLSCPVTLADISADALCVAEENARRLFVTPYTIVKSDLFSALDGVYDFIVSNPPYLTDRWIRKADEQVRKEPLLALRGMDKDGLGLIRRLIPLSRRYIVPGGRIFLECDSRQCNEVKYLLRASGYDTIGIDKDLGGRNRVVWGVRSCMSS